MNKEKFDPKATDEAARAAWLYYVGGRTQDEIAGIMSLSRQRVQRLISKAVADGIIRVRIEHPITDLMDLAARVKAKYPLQRVQVAPDIGVDGNLHSVAPIAAQVLESVLKNPEPQTIGFGTGRTLRAMIEELTVMHCPQHRLVSLTGNIAPDGTSSFYDVLMRLTYFVDAAKHYPLPTPVLAKSIEERDIYMNLTAVKKVLHVVDEADTLFVGIGQMDGTAPLTKDGFLSEKELQSLVQAGVVGEICGRPYNADGEYLQSAITERIASCRVHSQDRQTHVIGVAAGSHKVPAIQAAARGNIISELVTDEPTARALLAD